MASALNDNSFILSFQVVKQHTLATLAEINIFILFRNFPFHKKCTALSIDNFADCAKPNGLLQKLIVVIFIISISIFKITLQIANSKFQYETEYKLIYSNDG